MKDQQIVDVTKDVRWIGVLDPNIVTFDVVMETQNGTSYNSYFINAEKKTIVETVKESFWETYYEKLLQVVNPEEIQYIVLNHTEPDHSGCLANLLGVARNAQVVGSGNAIRYLQDQLGFSFPYLVVKDGQILDLGNKTLHFFSAPNLHWPDTQMCYLPEEKLLFTCDIFGEHFCHPALFDDLVDGFDDAFRYYFDSIMKPYSKFMIPAAEKAKSLDLQAICPGHGIILRKNWRKYVELSEQYAREAMQMVRPDLVLIAYVSAYRFTGTIAGLVAEGIREAGKIEVDVCDVEKMPVEEIGNRIAAAQGIILGCPTFNQNILLPIYGVLAMINPIRDRGKLAAAFGSYGWSGEGVKIMTSVLQNLKLKVLDEGLMVKFRPHSEVREKCVEYGRNFGRKFLGDNT
jgi:NADH oxidase (H2O-forming)